MAATGMASSFPWRKETIRSYLPRRRGAVHAIKWAVQRARYMTLETIAPMSDNPSISLPAMAS
jgi:hypothetical protein